MKIRILILNTALVAFSVPFITSAIGISATPATLSVKTVSGKEGIARFVVLNPSKEVGLFEAYPEEFEESITLIPSTFVLEAGKRREVLVRAGRREVGIIRTAIAIEAQRLGIPSLGVGGGIRLPFSLEVKAAQGSLAAVLRSGVAPTFITLVLTALVLLSAVLLYTLKRAARRDTL
ncbi:MAG TPA: hypothetical protein DEF00_01485 [Candidatus Taylorbacteria bacterium]|nr:MAG: hypothetical protein UY03_C0014G0005 [Parcubacteria group bacterium GW2011_GWA2_47_64]KKU97068.1 MAG: hypothetical protein UY29_C0003G0065 [Parcubacteria group bacterium GW2011_GWC2_48_17]HBV01050.1 hypothetical protein [Candidatus Taylorbacteria bacterium]